MAPSTDPANPITPSVMKMSARRLAHRAPVGDGTFLWENFQAITEVIDAGPHTVLHGDAHPGNTYFRDGRAGLLDWELLGVGTARDLAYTMVLGMLDRHRRAVERDLLDTYRQAMVAGGGPDIDRDDLFTRYRQAVLHPYVSALSTWWDSAVCRTTTWPWRACGVPWPRWRTLTPSAHCEPCCRISARVVPEHAGVERLWRSCRSWCAAARRRTAPRARTRRTSPACRPGTASAALDTSSWMRSMRCVGHLAGRITACSHAICCTDGRRFTGPHTTPWHERIAVGNEILRTQVGSGLHGVTIAGTDDRDEMGVCIEPPDCVIGLNSSTSTSFVGNPKVIGPAQATSTSSSTACASSRPSPRRATRRS